MLVESLEEVVDKLEENKVKVGRGHSVYPSPGGALNFQDVFTEDEICSINYDLMSHAAEVTDE